MRIPLFAALLLVAAREPGLEGKCKVTSTAPSVPIANVDRTVAALNTRFRVVFEAALRIDPTASGSARLAVEIAGNGAVVDVSVKPGTLPRDVVAGMEAVVRRARFAAPGTRASLTVSVVCMRAD